MWKFIKEMFKFDIIDEQKTKPFNVKLCEVIDRAEKTRKLILHSDLPEKDRSQIADEILYLTDDLKELQTIKLKEEDRIWNQICFINARSYGPF